MKNIIFFISFWTILTTYSQDINKLTFQGNINYTEQNNKSLINLLEAEYRVKLWEHPNKKYMIFFGGSIVHDYNIFMRSNKVSGFSQIGYEF